MDHRQVLLGVGATLSRRRSLARTSSGLAATAPNPTAPRPPVVATRPSVRSLLSRRTLLTTALTIALPRHRASAAPPPAVEAIIRRSLALDPATVNTDWFGTILLDGLLRWEARGVSGIREFAERWFDHHWNASDVSAFQGPKGRVFLAGRIPVTTYAGHFGLAFPCRQIASRFGDGRARRAVLDIADMILHHSARNGRGHVAHDDRNEFAIPDTCFFAVEALMLAADLAPERTEFKEQAVAQLKAYADTFLDPETKLAKTILRDGKLGDTFWTRASGWLLWAFTGLLRHLPDTDPRRRAIITSLRTLATGIATWQDSSGGFRVLLNEPETPLETTGTAMFASGLHESVRRGWIGQPHGAIATAAWRYVQKHLTSDGRIHGAYTGWAVPAEKREIEGKIDAVEMGWIPGFVLRTAAEMETA